MSSVRNRSFQNLLKDRSLLNAEKLANILDFVKESKKTTINYISTQLY